MKKIISVIGARPQFIKHAPMQLELQKRYNATTIHTGQHYDENMSAIFFEELKIKKPEFIFNLSGSKLQGEQTALMMIEIEKVVCKEKPNALLIYGDTNSTLAATLIASKLHIPIIHIEAGLRSYNRAMPEEINRIIADEFAYLLFCPTNTAIDNLKKEGIIHDRIFKTGDVMCDMVNMILPFVKKPIDDEFYFATLHRPYNTDNPQRLETLLKVLNNLDKKIIFSVHPRTLIRMNEFGLRKENYTNIEFIDPTSYIESISYQKYSSCVITDSGGIQKEAYILQKQCITLRSETEWVETLQGGWNTLVYQDLSKIPAILTSTLSNYQPDIYGTGNSASEICSIIEKYI